MLANREEIITVYFATDVDERTVRGARADLRFVGASES